MTHEPRTQDVLDRAAELAPEIAGRAEEIEAGRRLPEDLLGRLTEAGCFRMLLPPSHGGLGVDLPTALRVLETLSRADASAGWTVMIGAAGWCDVRGLPRATFDALYAAGPVIIGGAFSPSGTATAADGGYRVSGRWGFASGCEHSAWLYGNCVETPGDPPALRTVLFESAQVRIEDTWHVSGLRGTGSHHFRADDVFVPAERTFATLQAKPYLDEPIAHVPVPQLLALAIASVAAGIAQGALDDVLALAAGKVPLFGATTMAANPVFQFQLATADTELRAARALVRDCADAVWAAGPDLTVTQRAHARAASVWAVQRASAVVDTAYHAGGGSSLYTDCPLQRRLRDIRALTQHFLVRADTLVTAGAVLAGRELGVPVF